MCHRPVLCDDFAWRQRLSRVGDFMKKEPVLDYAAPESSEPTEADRFRAHGLLACAAGSYALLDVIVMSVTDDIFGVGPMFFWGALILMALGLVYGLATRPRPFHPMALVAFSVFMLATAFATIMYVGAVGNSI
jgi:hypothetical protein